MKGSRIPSEWAADARDKRLEKTDGGNVHGKIRVTKWEEKKVKKGKRKTLLERKGKVFV